MSDAALGLRIRSGAATAVLLAGPATSPQVIDRRTLTLCDPKVPKSRQPYHADFGTLQTDAAAIARLTRIVYACARRSVSAAIDDWRSHGYRLRGGGLVVGSDIDPARIANQHMRAHASEGRLFREATEHAIHHAGLSSSIFVERSLYAGAAQRLGQSEEMVKQTATELGRSIGGGWRADEKTATVAAWLVLARVRRSSRRS